MVKAFEISRTGDHKVLKLIKHKIPDPAPYEVTIRNKFIYVGHIDIHHRDGSYKLDKLPRIIGLSGVGEIIKIGERATEFKLGDRVAYTSLGAYSEEVNVSIRSLIVLDDDIPSNVAAAAYVPGLTAHYLIARVCDVKNDYFVVVHGASGSVGHLLCQWLSSLGAHVIATVGSDAKISAAKSNGAEFVINHAKENLFEKVAEITKNNGVNIVYDCYGKNFFEINTQLLTYLGLLINYGDVTGLVDNLSASALWAKSLFFTRPNFFVYKGYQMELILSAKDLFDNIRKRNLRPNFTTIDFANIPNGHLMLQERKIMGSLIAEVK